MNFFKAILMGLIQGATEFLPVSSSGHLAFFSKVFGLELDNSLYFDILLHLGTLVALVIVFHKEILHLLKEFWGILVTGFVNFLIFIEHRKGNKEISYLKVISNTYRKLVVMIIVSTIPTVILGLVGKNLVSWASQTLWMVALGLMVTAGLLVMADRHSKGTITIKKADYASTLFIGIAQGVATLPGISRSGSTISVAMMCGFKKETAVRYSFLLSIPSVLGAVVLDLKDISTEPFGSANLPFYIVATVVAGIAGYWALRLMLYMVKTKRYFPFAVYCAVMGFICFIMNFVLH